jgi:hypothetical protein
MSKDSAAPIAPSDTRPALERRIRALIRDVPDVP